MNSGSVDLFKITSQLYGPGATQMIAGGTAQTIAGGGTSAEYNKFPGISELVKLTNESLGRSIGRSLEDKPPAVEGGDYNPQLSFDATLEKIIMGMNGGARRKKSKRHGGAAKAKARKNDYLSEPIESNKSKGQIILPVADLAYCGDKDDEYHKFLYDMMLYWRITRLSSSTIVVIPPDDILKKHREDFLDYCEKEKIETNSIKAEEAVSSDTFAFWRNYIFSIYISSKDCEYRIDPTQNGGPNAYPNSTKQVLGVKFKRVNLNSYVWFFVYNPDEDCFYMYPNEDIKKENGIKLKFIGYAKQGRYLFQANKEIPDNGLNRLDMKSMRVSQISDMFMNGGAINGGADEEESDDDSDDDSDEGQVMEGGTKFTRAHTSKYYKPIANLVENWKKYGLQAGSEISLGEMYSTAPSRVRDNLSGNIIHSAILCALDGINPGKFRKLPQVNASYYDHEDRLVLNPKQSLEEFMKSVSSQYPQGTRKNIVKADVIYSLINGGVNPELAFNALDGDCRGTMTKTLTRCLRERPFEYFEAKAHVPIFCSQQSNDDAIKTIIEGGCKNCCKNCGNENCPGCSPEKQTKDKQEETQTEKQTETQEKSSSDSDDENENDKKPEQEEESENDSDSSSDDENENDTQQMTGGKMSKLKKFF